MSPRNTNVVIEPCAHTGMERETRGPKNEKLYARWHGKFAVPFQMQHVVTRHLTTHLDIRGDKSENARQRRRTLVVGRLLNSVQAINRPEKDSIMTKEVKVA